MGERFERANKICRRGSAAVDGMSTITGLFINPEREDISFTCQSIDLFAVQRAGRHAVPARVLLRKSSQGSVAELVGGPQHEQWLSGITKNGISEWGLG